MKKKNLILIIIIIIICGTIIDIFFWPHKTREEIYLTYLKNEYNLDFEILDKVQNVKEINEDYIELYNCKLKNSDIKFYVGSGKFKAEVWSIFKQKMNFDNYVETTRNYLQNKYKQTIIINTENDIDIASEQISNIIDNYNQDFQNFHLNYKNGQSLEFVDYLIMDIQYNGNLIKDVEISTNKEKVKATILETIKNEISS